MKYKQIPWVFVCILALKRKETFSSFSLTEILLFEADPKQNVVCQAISDEEKEKKCNELHTVVEKVF